MGQKPLFSKKSKRGYKRLFFICLRQASNKRLQTSIILIAPCSQEIIDHENLVFIYVFFFRYEMRLFGCYGNNDMMFFRGNHGHYLIKFHCYQFRS